MRPNTTNKGSGNAAEGSLIDHMKSSVQPAGGPGGLRSGYSGISGGPGGAVPAGSGVGGGGAAVPSSSTAAQQTRENLERALRTNEATNNSGYATLQSLGKQREVIQNSLANTESTRQHLSDSRQVIHDIRMGVYKEWLIKGGVIAFLVLLVVLIIYSKFIRK